MRTDQAEAFVASMRSLVIVVDNEGISELLNNPTLLTFGMFITKIVAAAVMRDIVFECDRGTKSHTRSAFRLAQAGTLEDNMPDIEFV